VAAAQPVQRQTFSACSWSPNAKWQWYTASFSLSLVALCSIQAGEEITIAWAWACLSLSLWRSAAIFFGAALSLVIAFAFIRRI
jgi:hypothetical protein